MTESEMWDEVASILKPMLGRTAQKVSTMVPCRLLPQELRTESIACQFNISVLPLKPMTRAESLADIMLQCWREKARWRLVATIWQNNESVFAEGEECIVLDPASNGAVRDGVFEEVKEWCGNVESFLDTHTSELIRSIKAQLAAEH